MAGPRPLTIATLNVHGMKAGWLRRGAVLAESLASSRADVFAIQESARLVPQARWLAAQVTRRTGRRYRAVSAPKRGWRGLVEGLAILTYLEVVDAVTIDLRGDARIAQQVTLTDGEVTFDLYNLHLSHGGERGALREAQAQTVLDAVGARQGVPVIVAGDFNGTPGSRAVRLLEREHRSAHVAAHGHEPDFTAPADAQPGHGWVLDYIFAGQDIEVLSCEVAFGPVRRGGRLVYPSDHLGLVASIRVGG